MDTAAALAKVTELLNIVDWSRQLWVDGKTTESLAVSPEVRRRLPVIRRIAQEAAPESLPLLNEERTYWVWKSVQIGLQQMQGLLAAEEELEQILGPIGPRVAADELHEWVWSAAASLWDDDYRREAVQAAATMVDTHTQAKLGRSDLSGADLMMQAWSTDPPREGNPRLRLSGFEAGTPTYTSAHEGAKFFGAGCMKAIRNIVTHRHEQPDPQTALEQLAALSVLARWVDEADVLVVTT
jgi:hypothetical protein